jgi:hypothetical protein
MSYDSVERKCRFQRSYRRRPMIELEFRSREGVLLHDRRSYALQDNVRINFDFDTDYLRGLAFVPEIVGTGESKCDCTA